MIRKVIYIITVLLMVSIIGCGDDYYEGDDDAEKAFKRMSAIEKQYYKRVQDRWGQKYLVHLREAIRNTRSVKPSERDIPFIDIAKVIKNTNDVVLVPQHSWGEDTVRKYNATKFNSIDPSWWVIISRATNGEYRRETLEEKSVKRLSIKTVSTLEQVNIPKQKIQDDINMNLLLTLDEYDEIGMQIGECQLAKDYLKMIASSGRALTIKDRDDLMRKILTCKTMELSESLQD